MYLPACGGMKGNNELLVMTLANLSLGVLIV